MTEQEIFDLILMDLHMPGLSGWDTTRLIRASPSPLLSRIPIIGLTADVLKESRQLCFDVGMNSVVYAISVLTNRRNLTEYEN